MNKNIKYLMESLFDNDMDNILSSDKDSIDKTFAEQIIGKIIGKDLIEYEAVDLDLPSGKLWCDRNIGASTPVGIGGYFRRNSFSISKIQLNKSKNINYFTYQELLDNHPEYCENVPEYILGDEWGIPTKDDITELINNTKIESIHYKDGVPCAYKLISLKNANKFIIIPISGRIKSHKVYDEFDAMFWSSTTLTNHDDCNYTFDIHSKLNVCLNFASKLTTLPIRACKK